MRQSQTTAELLVWKQLRARRLDGLKFRRQCPLGNYIADFLYAEHRLVIEIDGEYHDSHDQRSYDDDRTQDLVDAGFRVLRFRNEEVQSDIHAVLEAIRNAAMEQNNSFIRDPNSLSPQGEGGPRSGG